MQQFHRKAWWRQLDLFRAAPRQMTWAMLSAEAQQEVKRYLTRMLRQHLRRSRIDTEREVRHER
jgi:hypothetical protein